ncbi:MAG TPA: hypothetical protein VKH81_16050 [Candidatus Angelobacter sp.]|nr:hypothetical protein [Candidatus Angelobacter sp.]
MTKDQELWSRRYGSPVTAETANEITRNVVAFFSLLAQWDQEMIARVVPLPRTDKPWGVVVNGELFGVQKSRFDCDFAANIINDRGIEAYERLIAADVLARLRGAK